MANGNGQTLDGMPVVDANVDFALRITDRDIVRAKRRSPDKCAAAVACRREMDGQDARVHKTRTLVRQGRKWVRYVTPDSIRTEIMIFDRGGRMMPGDYILQAPRGAQRLGFHKKPTGPKRRTGHKRRVMHIIENVRETGPKLHEKGVE